MRSARFLIVATVVVLSGCGSDDAAETTSSATSTTSGPTSTGPTTTAEVAGADELCRASAEVRASFADEGQPATVADAGRQLLDRAVALSNRVLPAVPESLRPEADEYIAALRAAGDELVAYDGPTTDPSELTDADAPALSALRELSVATTSVKDPSTDTYANDFVAWTSEPCGPK